MEKLQRRIELFQFLFFAKESDSFIRSIVHWSNKLSEQNQKISTSFFNESQKSKRSNAILHNTMFIYRLPINYQALKTFSFPLAELFV